MARTNIPTNVTAFYAGTTNLSSAKARQALEKMDEDEYNAVLDEMPSAAPVETSDSNLINKPVEFKIVAEIIGSTELTGENEGSSVIECVDVKRHPLAFVVTNKQRGDAERKGFDLSIGNIFELTLETRVAGETQFIDNKTGNVETHTKDGNGFVRAGKVNRKVFDDTAADFAFDALIAKASAKSDQFQAILNAGIELQKAKMQYNR